MNRRKPARVTLYPKRSPIIGYVLSVFGISLIGIGTILGGIGAKAAVQTDGIPLMLVVGLVGGLSLFIGLVSFRRGKRHLIPSGEKVLARDTRPPVLYLRSFESDSKMAFDIERNKLPLYDPGITLVTDEEVIAKVFNSLGPCVALADPRVKLPELGMPRIYVADSKWRETIQDFMLRARLVTFLAGDGEHFWWEVERARRLLRLDQIVFLLPYETENPEYEVFRKKAESILGCKLARHRCSSVLGGCITAILYFTPNGTSQIMPLSSWEQHPYKRMLEEAIKFMIENQRVNPMSADINRDGKLRTTSENSRHKAPDLSFELNSTRISFDDAVRFSRFVKTFGYVALGYSLVSTIGLIPTILFMLVVMIGIIIGVFIYRYDREEPFYKVLGCVVLLFSILGIPVLLPALGPGVLSLGVLGKAIQVQTALSKLDDNHEEWNLTRRRARAGVITSIAAFLVSVVVCLVFLKGQGLFS